MKLSGKEWRALAAQTAGWRSIEIGIEFGLRPFLGRVENEGASEFFRWRIQWMRDVTALHELTFGPMGGLARDPLHAMHLIMQLLPALIYARAVAEADTTHPTHPTLTTEN